MTVNYPTKEGYSPGVWNSELPVDKNGLIDVKSHWIGCYGLYIFSDVFGYCPCGNPEEALRYIHRGLQLVNDLQTRVQNTDDVYTYSEWTTDCLLHFKTTQAQYFFFYWLDKEELTEHGGSVPGWLEPKGLEILEKLNSLGLENENYEFAIL